MAARRPYQKSQLRQHDLQETPKLWKLLQAVLAVRYEYPGLLTDTLRLAYYSAALATGMPVAAGPLSPELAAAPPRDPEHIDHGTGVIGDRLGRLAGINVCSGRACALIRDRLHLDAHELIRETLRELGQEKPLDRCRCAGVGSLQ